MNLSPLLLNVWEAIVTRIQNGHGILITVIGLVAVFSGLVILWMVTANLPRLISLIEGEKRSAGKEKKPLHPLADKSEEKVMEEVAVAIAVTLCCELEEEEISVITLRHIEHEMSPWVVASRPTTMRHS